jgi:glycosyltransferase involved in cell wall biosynthesis
MINILVIPSDNNGVGFYRSILPTLNLKNLHPDLHFDINFDPPFNEDFLKQYNIIHFHKRLNNFENLNNIFSLFRKLGIITIMDLDDHWRLHDKHPNYQSNKITRTDLAIVDLLKRVDYVTTTTDKLAYEIGYYNQNVIVIPNALDAEAVKLKISHESSDRIRFGWAGGSTHYYNLKLLEGLPAYLKQKELLDKIQLVLCGFDIEGKIKMIDKKGHAIIRDAFPKESIYNKFEQIFTYNYKTISSNYKDYLLTYNNKEEYNDLINEPYRRVWTKPVTSYTTSYNLFDVALAPLLVNEHNECKSQLKLIESGFYHMPIIAQDIFQYKIDIIDGYNGFLINKKDGIYGWYDAIKFFIDNPEQISIMGENLYNTVKDKYDINNINKLRVNLYTEILNK